MNYYSGVALTLLALVAGMYLLSKVKAEMHPAYFRWVAWIVIWVSLLLIICQLAQGIIRMSREVRHPDYRHQMPGMMYRGWDRHHDGMFEYHYDMHDGKKIRKKIKKPSNTGAEVDSVVVEVENDTVM